MRTYFKRDLESFLEYNLEGYEPQYLSTYPVKIDSLAAAVDRKRVAQVGVKYHSLCRECREYRGNADFFQKGS